MDETKFQTLRDLLQYLCTSKTGVFINGMGIGRIDCVHNDYLDFQIINEENKKYYCEKAHIPIAVITDISKGRKEVPKNEIDTKIDNDLGGIL